MRILVTGATGYIGSRLVDLANAGGHSITIASATPTNVGSDWIKFQLQERPSFIDLHPVDAVIHLAANTSSNKITAEDEIAAADDLIAASIKYGARFVFVSSQTANEDAPTSYGRIKWRIEQQVLDNGGFVARLGQVYGGAERGLFGILSGIVRKYPLLPAFFPRVTVQPIHVDDCVEGLLKLVELKGLQPGIYCLASPTPISFTKFLHSIARNRLRRHRLFMPVPTALIRLVARLVGTQLGNNTGIYRLNSLLALPVMETSADIETIGLNLRNLQSGMHRSGNDNRRRLITEGIVLLTYILKENPRCSTVRRYARMIEMLHDGVPLQISALLIRWPILIALLDSQSHTGLPSEERLRWRLDAATLIAESGTQGANRFLGSRSSSGRIPVTLRLIAAVLSGLFWRVLRLLTPLSMIRIT